MGKGKDIPRELTDRALGRALGRKIARLERHVRELETASQAAHRSVEDGAIDVYDDNDVLRERIGKQADGSFGRKTFTGDIPPAPTEPDVQVISDGVVAVTWDGRWEERYSHVGWRNVQIHMSDTETFTPDRDTQVGAIFAPRGGTIVAVTESDDDNPVWVRLVGMNDAGQTGDPSVAVLVDELDEDDLEDEPEELSWEDGDGHTLTAGDIASGTVTFGLSHIPEQESLLAWWHPGGLDYAGEEQDPSQFSIDFEAGTVTWPLSGFEKANDRLRVYYAYYGAPGLYIPLGEAWSYATGLGSSTTYADPAFDDSSWATGPTPFGWGDAEVSVTWATTVPEPMDVWHRITRESFGGDLVFSWDDIDDDADVYLDGVLVQHVARVGPTSGENTGSFTVTGVAAGLHVFAVHGTDFGDTDSYSQKGYVGFSIQEVGV